MFTPKFWMLPLAMLAVCFVSACESNTVVRKPVIADSTAVVADTTPAVDYNSEEHSEEIPEEKNDPFEVVAINEYDIDIHNLPNEWGEKNQINDSLMMLTKNNQAHILYKRKSKNSWQGVDFPEVDSVQFVDLNQRGSRGAVIYQTHFDQGSGGITSTSSVTILDISAQPTFIFYAASGCAVEAFGRYESPPHFAKTELPISIKEGVITIGTIGSNEVWAENGYECEFDNINPGRYAYVDGKLKPIQ